MVPTSSMERKTMAKLIFVPTEEEKEVADGSPLQEACEEAGVPFACTEGVCGTCVIEVPEGMENLSAFTQEERDFLGDQDRERLACQCKIKSGSVKINF
jgi:ferredoxin